MQKAMQKSFNFSLVDNQTSDFLKQCENNMRKIVGNASTELGKQLYLAQQRLADHNNGGLFAQWVESIGISRRNAYNYINRYTVVQKLHNEDEIETFESLPKTLSFDISKPSAPKEVVQKVMSGDIKTHKEYQELERQLKLKQEELEDRDCQIKQLQARKPEVHTEVKTERVEVKPADYEQIKQDNTKLQEKISWYKDELQAAQSLRKQAEQQLNYENDQRKQQAKKLDDLKIQTTISIYSEISAFQKFLASRKAIDSNELINADSNDKSKLQALIHNMYDYLDQLSAVLNGQKIIEAEVENND